METKTTTEARLYIAETEVSALRQLLRTAEAENAKLTKTVIDDIVVLRDSGNTIVRLKSAAADHHNELIDVVDAHRQTLSVAMLDQCPSCGAAWGTSDACDTCPSWVTNGGHCENGWLTGCPFCLGCEGGDQ